MKKIFELDGVVAGLLLIAFGIAAIVRGFQASMYPYLVVRVRDEFRRRRPSYR